VWFDRNGLPWQTFVYSFPPKHPRPKYAVMNPKTAYFVRGSFAATAIIPRFAICCWAIRIFWTMNSRFYITTPIYYPNGEPHVGHVYTTVAADTVARYHRLNGDETYFVTGTDEHGVKMVKTAAAMNITPLALADEMSGAFRSLWKDLNITNDGFLRTSETRHRESVHAVVNKMLAKDDIYLGFYTGWYDEGQEAFVTETEAKLAEFKSTVTGRPLTRYEEPSYFFRLKKYVPRIQQYIEDHPDFIQPTSRRNEVISKLKAGVEDLSISRATLEWGIKMPNDPKHVVFVWIDALTTYISSLGYGRPGQDELFQKFWPANVHLIGKEIMWFHTVYWPAMLFSLDLPLPKVVFAHGWWTRDGKKMSKSLDNFIDVKQIKALSEKYSFDAVRYYLLRAAVFGSDLDWSDREFDSAYDDLCKKLGNCLNRVTSMTFKNCENTIPPAGELEDIDRTVLAAAQSLPKKLADAYGRIALQECATLPIDVVRAVDGYIEATQPFRMKDPTLHARRNTVLNVMAQGIYAALVGLLPVIPDKAAAGLKQLGVDVTGRTMPDLFQNGPSTGHKLGEGSALFPRVDTK
jgi:methionyl-tRNA synthetase